MEKSRYEELNNLALEVLDTARSRLIMNLRFMDAALSFHGRAACDATTMASDSLLLYYDPVWVLRTYRRSMNELTRTYLHTVLHCIFHNPFSASSRDRRLWDLASDIAAESTAIELDLVCTRTAGDADRMAAIKHIRRESGYLTAEKIYSWLSKGSTSDRDLESWAELFRRDDHSLWYETDSGLRDALDEGGSAQMIFSDDSSSEKSWKDMAEHIEMDVEMFAKVKGRYASSLVQNLRAVNRETYDYREFLRKFSAPHERIRVSDDEFDYIYYTYGLRAYGNMPLIEPLEYREDSRIHDFVIAIDTSGSVAGEEVQQFLQKTYNILRSRESFDRKINLHIIQCDAEIQSDSVITSPEDFDRYIETMEIRGLGGTDFRPVFRYVDGLIESGDLSDMRGLIYFTDGLGTYPSEKPDYRSAFVFIESGYNIPEVPPWAIKLVLQPEEL